MTCRSLLLELLGLLQLLDLLNLIKLHKHIPLEQLKNIMQKLYKIPEAAAAIGTAVEDVLKFRSCWNDL